METLIFNALNGLLIMVSGLAVLYGAGFLFILHKVGKVKKLLEADAKVGSDNFDALFKALKLEPDARFFTNSEKISKAKEEDFKKSLTLISTNTKAEDILPRIQRPVLGLEPPATPVYKVYDWSKSTTKVFTPKPKPKAKKTKKPVKK